VAGFEAGLLDDASQLVPAHVAGYFTILEAPDALEAVPVELLRRVVDQHRQRPAPAEAPPRADDRREPAPPEAGPKVAWVEEWLEANNVEVRWTKVGGGSWAYRWGVACPFCGEDGIISWGSKRRGSGRTIQGRTPVVT
jgi:hypothetical protein